MIRINNKEFISLQEAIDSIDNNNQNNIDIYIDGIINERVELNKPNITIIGGIIKYSCGAYEMHEDGFKRGTFRSYVVYVNADNVTLNSVTIINEAPYTLGQAIALMVDGSNFIAIDCKISSYQDTLFVACLPDKEIEKNGFIGPLKDKDRIVRNALFINTIIEGSVDFIFGGGRCIFKKCIINSLKEGYIVAPCTKKDEKYGFIFDECKFVSDLKKECVYLARPWRENAKCLIVNSIIGDHIYSDGYDNWGKDMKDVEFKEYNNSRKSLKYVSDINEDDLKYIEMLNIEKK